MEKSSVVFKYGFSGYVHRKIQKSVKWASIARVTQEAGFRGVLLIRYSIIPPREYCEAPSKVLYQSIGNH